MLQVIAMCGVAFSGKTTLARRIAEALSADLISLDAINGERGLSGGQGMTIAQWEETSAIAMRRLRAFLQVGRSVVVDDTFSHRMLRERCKAVAHENAAKFTIVFVDTPITVIRERRERNGVHPSRHHVDDDVFEAHYNTFQFPTADESVVRIASGFDVTAWLAQQARTA
jgi:predicted kinase